MKKSDIKNLPLHFDEYIKLAGDEDLLTGLQNSLIMEKLIDISLLEKNADYCYKPGKWSVKGVLQHIIDAERILAYRALRFARNDKTVLSGFDEALYGANSPLAERTINDLLEELKVVRIGTILLFKNFNEEILLRRGVCFNIEIDVLSLGFSIIGHQQHHFNVISKNYFNKRENNENNQ